jgi:hypothetical protein
MIEKPTAFDSKYINGFEPDLSLKNTLKKVYFDILSQDLPPFWWNQEQLIFSSAKIEGFKIRQ